MTSRLDQPGGLTGYAIEMVFPDGQSDIAEEGIHSTLGGAAIRVSHLRAAFGDALTLRVVPVTITRKGPQS